MRKLIHCAMIGLMLTAFGCSRHTETPSTPAQRQSSGIEGQILQVNQNPQLTPAQKQQLIAQIRATAPTTQTH